MTTQRHPISTWLDNLRKSPKLDNHSHTQIATFPKFWVEHHSALPPDDQIRASHLPPLPYPNILLGTKVYIKNKGTDDQFLSTMVMTAARLVRPTSPSDASSLRLVATLTDTHNKPFPVGVFNVSDVIPGQTYIGDISADFEGVPPLGPKACEAFGPHIWNFFAGFMALLSAENVSISPPPTNLSRKRELARIKQGKRVENYHLYHLRINRHATTSTATPTASSRRAHWRRAHLRHYIAGVGHIKTTKTIAIAPAYIGTNSTGVDKDYII